MFKQRNNIFNATVSKTVDCDDDIEWEALLALFSECIVD